MASCATYRDACCYHAALATVLTTYGCPEPALVLATTAASHATVRHGRLHFDDVYPDLAAACVRRGFRCARRPALAAGAWEETVARVRSGQPVVGLLDSYHLPYHWIDRKRRHNLHAVVIDRVDDAAERVRLRDATDVLAYDAVVLVSSLQDAWSAEDRGQAWIDLEPSPAPAVYSPGALTEEAAGRVEGLFAVGPRLSCAALAEHVLAGLDVYLRLAGRVGEPNPRLGADEPRRAAARFRQGIWNYHHRLRWVAGYLGAVARTRGRPGGLDGFSAVVDELAQSWLVVRNLFIKYGLSAGPAQERLRGHCAGRLEQIRDQARHHGPRLADALRGHGNSEPAGMPR